MNCACGQPMACVNSRPYERDPRIVRLRVYRCQCGSEEATIEVRDHVAKIKHFIRVAEKRQRRIQRRLDARGGDKCQNP